MERKFDLVLRLATPVLSPAQFPLISDVRRRREFYSNLETLFCGNLHSCDRTDYASTITCVEVSTVSRLDCPAQLHQRSLRQIENDPREQIALERSEVVLVERIPQ